MASRQPRKDLVPFALVKINSVRFSNRESRNKQRICDNYECG